VSVKFLTKLNPDLSDGFDRPRIYPSGLFSLFSAYATDRSLCKSRFLHFCIAPVLGLTHAGKSST